MSVAQWVASPMVHCASLVQLGTQSPPGLHTEPAEQPVPPAHDTHRCEVGSQTCPWQSEFVRHSTQIPVVESQSEPPRPQSAVVVQPLSHACVDMLHFCPFWQSAAEAHSTQLPLAVSQTRPNPEQSAV